MPSVLQRERLASHQTNEGFIDERRALQCVIGAFGLQVIVRELSELLVHHRRQCAEGCFVSVDPSL
jgi:hypothetical protein